MIPEPYFSQWFEQHRTQLDAVILDIDGVLLNGKLRLTGSKRTLELFRRHNLPFLFLTNDGNHSTREKAHRMNDAGLAVSPTQIVSCGHAIAPLVKSMGVDGTCFFAMGDTGTPCYAEAAGLEVTRDLNILPHCAGVIIGEDNYNWEPVINAVINYLIDHPDAPLIVPNPDNYYPGSRLKIHVGAGGVGRFIKHVLDAYGIEINPIYLGKPYSPIFKLAEKELERRADRIMDPKRILMVGDNMAADIAGGSACGYRTALMLSGVTELSALNNWDVLPDMVFESL